jgi:hypothetical protein
LSAALLYALGQRNGRVGLPEVLENEIVKHLVLAAEDYTRSYEEAASALDELGIHTYTEPPFSEEAIQRVPKQCLERLDPFLVRIPMTLDHARRALKRVNEGTPPNTPKSQQFKDSVLWEAVLELGNAYNVVLVTADRGFFEDRNPKSGLAQNLAADCEDRHVGIRVLHIDRMEELLRELQDEAPQLDESKITRAVTESADRVLREMMDAHSVEVSEHLGTQTEAYVTGTPRVLAIAFTLRYRVVDTRPATEGRSGDVFADGSCEYFPDQGNIDKTRISSYSIHWESEGDLGTVEGWYPDLLSRALGEEEETRGLPLPWPRKRTS